jgi:hypothetical protein
MTVFSKLPSRSTSFSRQIGGSMIRLGVVPFSWIQNNGRIVAPDSFARLTIPVGKNSVRPRNRTGINLCPRLASALMQIMPFCFNSVRRLFANARDCGEVI